MRNARSTGAGSFWNWSSAFSTVGPWYHGRWAERSAMLSPPRADTGMKQEGLMPTWSRNAPYSLTMRSNTARSQPDQVHLVHHHRELLMPSSDTM